LHWINAVGYRSLVLLAFVLPFDLTQHPLLQLGPLAVTNLTILLWAVGALAGSTLICALITGARRPVRSTSVPTTSVSRQRFAAGLFMAFLLSSIVTTLVARDAGASSRWLVDVVMGALLWLAVPFWLADEVDVRVSRVVMALVAGAVISSVVGFAEFWLGPNVDRSLAWVKVGPTTMGPYLRLSGTFSHANVAAMYIELALPFALVGLVSAVLQRPGRLIPALTWLGTVDVLLLALLLTYSRGGMLGLTAAMIAMALASRDVWRWELLIRRRHWLLGIAANLVLVIGAFALSSSSIVLLRVTTQTDQSWYNASYVGSVPVTMRANQAQAIRVTVENLSPLAWTMSSKDTYGLSYHWLYPSWRIGRFRSTITWLSRDVRPGGTATVLVMVRPPERPGRYLLVWDLLWDDTTWFGLKTGVYRPVSVRILGGQPDTRAHALTQSAGRADPPFTYLPTNQVLDRAQIWTSSLAIIERQPLLGAGLDAVWNNYARVAKLDPRVRAGSPPAHAHNLILELLADWGLVGGGLLLGWLVAAWWPFLARARHGSVRATWQIAAIGAAAALLGHEMVDYFLETQAILGALWLISGLAAVMDGGAQP
jgi:O-antigen ligase